MCGINNMGPREAACNAYIYFLTSCDALADSFSDRDKAIFWQAIRDNMKQAIEESV